MYPSWEIAAEKLAKLLDGNVVYRFVAIV